METPHLLTWIGIALCLSQSAMLSGLNLAYFSLDKLDLQVRAKKNDPRAQAVLKLREDANFVLVTILWGNVAVNVLLALLAGSVLAGVAAFLFSTVIITLFAEIAPQAYFSRNALRVASVFAPVLRAWQVLLYPVARPTALVLDRWLGKEAIRYYREQDLRDVIKLHMDASESDIAKVEGQGALNFLALDDVPFVDEGEAIDPDSVIRLEFADERPVFPNIERTGSDPFLQAVNRSGRKWVVITDMQDNPRLIVNADDLLRDALLNTAPFRPLRHCHRPVITANESVKLGDLLPRLKVTPQHVGDDVIENDVILLWGATRRLMTGADVLGRLLRGIARIQPVNGSVPLPAGHAES
jgi:metal transporter CNNM